MSVFSKGIAGIGVAGLGGLVALTLGAVAPQPAAAQDFFGNFFGGFDNGPRYERRQHASRPQTSRSYAAPDRGNAFPFPFFDARRPEQPQQQRQVRTPARAAGATVHCVRMCDGRYFPLPRAAGGVRLDPAKVCSALCPAAETKVFHGGDMQYARAADGTRYASLDTAFTFRERLVDDCSCTGRGPGGLAQIDLESDPTLRAGDIVVTAEGPAVFRGSRQFPYQTADFTPIDDYERLNQTLRATLAELQVNTSVAPVLPPQRLSESAQQELPSRAERRAAPDPEAAARRRAVQQRQRQAQRQEYERRQWERQRSAQRGFFGFW